MTSVAHKTKDKDSMVVRIDELTDAPLDCTMYRADLLKGFTLREQIEIYGTSVNVCVSPLPYDGEGILVPESAFSGEVLRVGWVTLKGVTLFRWYLLDRGRTGDCIVWKVKEVVRQKRDAVTYQTVMVPEVR